jgi:4-amino-4-deoxy-L-arabinose transferase-like glycosyltransferase
MGTQPAVSASRWKTLAALSALFVCFNILLHSIEPISDGDSFEYAGVARNILRGEGLREDLLRSYAIPDQPLPHPASQRANLYVFFVVPFQAVFGDSHWAFLAPSLLGIFIFPLAVYWAGRRLFGEDPAWHAAILSLFLPSFLRLYYLADPGLPEVWQMIFYLLFAVFLYEERYAAAGLLMGLAYQFRPNSVALIPAALIWMAIRRRDRLFSAGTFKMFAVAFLLVFPFLVRNWMVFGSPTYNEQIVGAAKVYDGTLREHFEDARMFAVVFNHEAYHGGGPAPSGSFASNFAAVLLANAKMALFGKQSDILYIPGIFQTIGLLALPFIVLGVRSSRGSPAAALALSIIILQCAMHIVMITYSDRYVMCVAPFAFMLCGAGFAEFRRVFSSRPLLSSPKLPAAIITFLILSESAGLLVFSAARMAGDSSKNIYTELKTTCEHIRKTTAPGDVVMTYPFFSTHYLCDRPTVPLPYGNIGSVAEVAAKYDVRNIVFASAWRVDRFPELPFTTTVASGMRLTLYSVDRDKLNEYLKEPSSNYIEPLNPVASFLSGRFNFEFAPPLYKVLPALARGVVPGLAAYIAVFLLFALAFLSPKSFARSASLFVLSVAIVAAQIVRMSAIFTPILAPAPPLSMVQATLAAESAPAQKQSLVIVSESPRNAVAIQSALSKRFPVSSVADAPPDSLAENSALFIAVPPVESWLSDESSLKTNMQAQSQSNDKRDKAAAARSALGETAIPIAGGVLSF